MIAERISFEREGSAYIGGFARLMGMDWSACPAVDRDPQKLGGAWCFAGTRVPVLSLFEHLDKGSTIREFLAWFPVVSPEQVHEVLTFAKASLEQPAAVAFVQRGEVKRVELPDSKEFRLKFPRWEYFSSTARDNARGIR
ncbi:MAG: DUF433 domain-containing protein [Acidobacteriaceae bacterium]|nr:DUF433 domain-containing protein [Acidobacteriaceae bacterium]MBV9781932.1 DUF433 domain-containing protein [Acidobacteriaceae bacterium]